MTETLGFIQNLRGPELIIILVLALVLFGGAKKLPDAARGVGRALRIFKSETKGLVSEDSAQAPALAKAKADVTAAEAEKSNQPAA